MGTGGASGGASMHLDTIMTQVDRDAFTIYPGVRDELIAYTLRPDQAAAREDDLFAAVIVASVLTTLAAAARATRAYPAEALRYR